MPQTYIIWDGMKAVPLSAWGADFIRPSPLGGEGEISPLAAYQMVAWVRRCIDLRANGISAMPFEVLNDQGEAVDWPVAQKLPPLLRQAEIALCIYGAAYWLIERRGRLVLGLRYLAPQTVTPRYDDGQGLIGFERAVGARRYSLALDDVIWFFEPGPDQEIGPGIPLIQSALSAASSAHQANEFIAGFFQRGAITALLLSVEGNPPQEELRRLEAWWKQMLRGVRRAWETIAVRASVKPQQIGVAPGKDLAMEALWESARKQIAVAFGVPQTLIEDAANYATAREHRLSFYEETVIPRARWMEAIINERLMGRLGLRLRFRPDLLEIFQQREAEKATGLVQLVQAGIMDVREARVQMGLEEPHEGSIEMAEVEEESAEAKARREAILADLRRWRERAKSRPQSAAEFKSEFIPPSLAGLVRGAIEAVGPNDAFRFLKQAEPSRDEAEREIQRLVEQAFAGQEKDFARAIAKKDDVALEALLAGMSNELRASLVPALTKIAFEEILRNAYNVGVDFDVVVVNKAALDWAQQYTYDLVKGITDTTRNLIRSVISQYVSVPGMTEAQVEELLAPAFGSVRAKMISVTETTRAYAQAAKLYQSLLRDAGLELKRVWQTRNDGKVCDLCRDLHGQTEDVWGEDFPNGPPRHVNCRCWVTLRYVRRNRS